MAFVKSRQKSLLLAFKYKTQNILPFRLFSFKSLKSHMMNSVIKAEIKNSIKSDRSIVFIDLEINDVKRGPGIFKLNNSLLIDNRI